MAAPTAASLSAAAARVAARYDLVLRLRPDLCFCGPLDLGPVLRSPGSYWMPWAAPHAGLAFDQIAVGSPTMIAQYAAAYSASVTGEVAASTELYPEAVMWRALERTTPGGAPRLASLAGFRASLARHRADGSPHYDDPYGKLRQDLMAPAFARADIAAALPQHQCRPRDHARKVGASDTSPDGMCHEPNCRSKGQHAGFGRKGRGNKAKAGGAAG